MKWHDYLCFALFAFLSFFVGSVIINQKTASAVSDLTFTFESGVSYPNSSTHLFPSCETSSCLSQYHYLIAEVESPVSSFNNGFRLVALNNNDSNELRISLNSSFSIYSIPSGFDRISLSQITTFNSNVTLILTESYQSCPSVPSGSITLTENGTFDVTNYAEAVVDVPMEVVPGDYHDDLVSLKKAIVIVPAVALVIYFLYAIYKMLLGGKTL